MIEGKFIKYKEDLSDIILVRKKVFHEYSGVSSDCIVDNLDICSEHVIVYNEKKEVVATGRLTLIDGRYWISKVGVLKEYRGNYYGDFVVRMLIDRVFSKNVDDVWLKTSEETCPFFQKIGFEVVEMKHREAHTNLLTMNIHAKKIRRKCKN